MGQARRFVSDLPSLPGAPDSTELLTIEWKGKKYQFSLSDCLGGGIAPVIKSGAYTMAGDEHVVCLSDGAGTGYTITAPATIAAGDRLTVTNINEGDLVTFGRNGHTLQFKGADVADDITLEPGDTVEIVCSDASTMEIF